MAPSGTARSLTEWVAAVARELGLAEPTDPETVDVVLRLTADVAHGVSRPGAPVTAFLVGLAAGRADDPAAAAREYAGEIGELARSWKADAERGLSTGDEPRRT